MSQSVHTRPNAVTAAEPWPGLWRVTHTTWRSSGVPGVRSLPKTSRYPAASVANARHSCSIEPSHALTIQEVTAQSHLAAVCRTSTRSMHGRGLCICLRSPETSNAPSERLSLQRCPRRSQSCAIPSDSDSASPPAANSASARARAGRWRRGGSLNLSAAGSLEA